MGNSGSATSRILVLGIDGAGKTSFLNKYENPGADLHAEPTEAYVIKDVKVKGVKLNVWDVAGKQTTRSLWKHYYEQATTDAIIWVIDGADSEERLTESRNALNSSLLDPHLQGVILCILVNKSDLDSCRSEDEMNKFLEVSSQEGKRTAFLHMISAKTGDGIKEAMEQLAKELKAANKKKA